MPGVASPAAISPAHTRSPEREEVACPLCGATRSRLSFRTQDLMVRTEEVFAWVVCAECNLYYLNPRPPASVIGEFYPDTYYSYQDEGHAVPGSTWSGQETLQLSLKSTLLRGGAGTVLYRLLKAVKGSILRALAVPPEEIRIGIPPGPPGRILDVGCGAGQFLDRLQRAGWETWGVEISPDAAERARLRGHQVAVGHLVTLDLPSASFDAVRLWHTLEHVHDPVPLLRSCRRLLKPEGTLIIGVPNVAGVPSFLYGRYWMGWDVPRHMLAFSPAVLRRLLAESGFETTDLHIFATPLLLALSAAWKRGHALESLDEHPASSRAFYHWLATLFTCLRLGDVMSARGRPLAGAIGP